MIETNETKSVGDLDNFQQVGKVLANVRASLLFGELVEVIDENLDTPASAEYLAMLAHLELASATAYRIHQMIKPH